MAWINESAGPGVAFWDGNGVNPTGNDRLENAPTGDGTVTVGSAPGSENPGAASNGDDVDITNIQSILEAYREAVDSDRSWSAEQAQLNRDYQTEQNNVAMAYNSAEAEKNRQWQEYMSNTSISRQMADLKNAGLNPVLAAKYMGASSGSGSTASVSAQSGSMATNNSSLASVLSSTISSLINAATGKYSADKSVEASKYSSDTSKTVAEINKESSEMVAKINQETQQNVETMKEQFEKWMKVNYPENKQDRINSIIYQIRNTLNETVGSETTDNMILDLYSMGIKWNEEGLGYDWLSVMEQIMDIIGNSGAHVIESLFNQVKRFIDNPSEYGSEFIDKIKNWFNEYGKG